jgi:membrane-bound metal-dependent hydrolase YbcI (DUF457 family)
VDPLTHGLASLALQRGFFPRANWRSVLVIVAAGIVADIDWFTASGGPASYLRWHRSATHSILFLAALALVSVLFVRVIQRKANSAQWVGLTWLAITSAATLHILMDSLQADFVQQLWPFSAKHLALDLFPAVDPWLMIIFAAAILLPELFRLVSDEIGSRVKRPRGRNGAIAGFAMVVLYLALRTVLHGNVTAALEARAIAGETPRRVAALPDSASPFLWHSIVETDSTLNLATLRILGTDVTYASGVTTLRKPEPSAILSAAQASPAAIAFLKTARFPKATTQRETEGFSAEIIDLKDQALEEKSRAIFADINLDKSGAVMSSELQWRANPKP